MLYRPVTRAKSGAREEWLLLLRRLAEAGAEMQPALREARGLGDDALARAAIKLGDRSPLTDARRHP